MRKWVMAIILTSGFLLLTGFNSAQSKVYDYADLFTEEEEQQLQELAVEKAQETQLDIIILTTEDKEGKSEVTYSDDFYDKNSFGYEREKGSGILLMIDMEDRRVYINTAEDAVNYFSDSEIDSMCDEISSYLSDGDYYGGSRQFINILENYKNNENGNTANGNIVNGYTESSNTESSETNLFTYLKDPLISFMAAFLMAALFGAILCYHTTTKMTATGYTYMNKNEYRENERLDIFTHTTTVARKIEPPSSKGGGSFHMSGGGVKHGGGGRGF